MKHLSLWTLLVLAAATPALRAQASRPASACITCHQDEDLFDEESRRPATLFADDVHARAGLSCQDCHGGNPDPRLAADADASMDARFRSNPFVGAPGRASIPQFCGRCHSDPAYMKRFKPDIRVDQESEYWTSQHGISLRQGDTKVATCVDCHHAHGVLRPANPRSPVYPTQVAETCGHCHADAERMKGYKLPDGRPLPVDQKARWEQSVHAASMTVKQDLTAPTCNDCHGNHGATPPGLQSIAFVCGQCHGREADLFRASGKHDLWQQHNEFLAEAGPDKCAACHSAPEPAAEVKDVRSFSECSTCHSNHGIVRPTVAIFSSLPETPCAFCHEGQLAEELQDTAQHQKNYQQWRDQLVEEAKGAGLQGDALFDALVDKALMLPTHTVSEGAGAEGKPQLRPEFERLFNKFRIGKTYYTYPDPVTGEIVQQPVVRCGHCHGRNEEDASLTAGDQFLSKMRQLTAVTATAERVLLAAQRGGVETREAFLQIDRAVDAQISLEVLVHTFADIGAFADKQQEGTEEAQAALETGHMALDELAARRKGLFVSLFFIALVLVGLGLKIRQLSAP